LLIKYRRMHSKEFAEHEHDCTGNSASVFFGITDVFV